VKKSFEKIKTYLLEYTQTQLVITLVSLPILASWGLGFSLLGFFGNLIFTPVLTSFLVISCLLFFTELLGIPNSILVSSINKLSDCWCWLLSQGSPSWILACAKPPALLIIIVPAITFYIVKHPNITTNGKRMTMLSLTTLAVISLFALQRYHNHHKKIIHRFSSNLYCIKLSGKPSVIMIDEGFFARKKSAGKAVQYELRPWMNKIFGNVGISELRINNPTGGSFQAAHCICQLWNVKEVWLPFFEKKLSKYAWRCFFDMKRYLDIFKIRLNRYNLEHFYPYNGNRVIDQATL